MGISLFNLATADLWDEVGKVRMGRLDENEADARLAFFGYRTRATARPPSTRPTWAGPKGTRAQSFHFRHTTVSKPSKRLLTRYLRCDAPCSGSSSPGLDFHVYASKLARSEEDRQYELLHDRLGPIEVTNIGLTLEEAEAFWDAVEQVERRDGRVQSRLACEIPAELEASDVRELLRHFTEAFWDHGLAFYAVVHRPGPTSDRRNVHAHILYHDRAALPDGAGGWRFAPTKAEAVRAGTWIPRLRERWAESANRMLEIASYRAVEAGGEPILKRYDPRPFAEVGVCKTPTMHLGPKWAALERAGVPTRIGAANAARELRWQMIGEPTGRRETAAGIVAGAIEGVARDIAEATAHTAAETAAERCLEALDALGEAHGRLDQALETAVPDLVLARAYRHHDQVVDEWLVGEMGRLAFAAKRARAAEAARQAGRAAPRGRALDAGAAYGRAKAALAMRVAGGDAGLREGPRPPRPLPHTPDGLPRGSDEGVRTVEQRFAEAIREVERARLELQLTVHAARLADLDSRRRALSPLATRSAASEAPAESAARELRAAGRFATERDEAAGQVRQALRPVTAGSAAVEGLLRTAAEAWTRGGHEALSAVLGADGLITRMRPQEAEQVRGAVTEFAQAAAAAAAAQRMAEAARVAAEEEERWLAALRSRQEALDEAAEGVRIHGGDLRRWFSGLYRDGGVAALAQLTAWGREETPPTAPMVSAAMLPGGLGLTVPGVDPASLDPEGPVDQDPQKQRAAVAWLYVRRVRQEEERRRGLEEHLAGAPERVLPPAAASILQTAREVLETEAHRHGQALVDAVRDLWRSNGGLSLPSGEEMVAVVVGVLPPEERAHLLGPVRAAFGLKALPPQVTEHAPSKAAETSSAIGASAMERAADQRSKVVEQGVKETGDFGEDSGSVKRPASPCVHDAGRDEESHARERQAATTPDHIPEAAIRDEMLFNSRAEPTSAATSTPLNLSSYPLVALHVERGSEADILNILRALSIIDLKTVGNITKAALDKVELMIRTQGVTRRRLEAQEGLLRGRNLISVVLAQHNETITEHRPKRPQHVRKKSPDLGH